MSLASLCPTSFSRFFASSICLAASLEITQRYLRTSIPIHPSSLSLHLCVRSSQTYLLRLTYACLCIRCRSQSYVDYSYPDDFTMEDMTEPDTMINFSALPQQPNYYQCPQTAGDNLNLGFNMSLHAAGQPGFAPVHGQLPVPAAHQHPQTQSVSAVIHHSFVVYTHRILPGHQSFTKLVALPWTKPTKIPILSHSCSLIY